MVIMAKSKIKTHKMASVQRKAIQSARAKKWDSHWFDGFSGACPLPDVKEPDVKEPVFSWEDFSETEKQEMLKQALISQGDYENSHLVPDADFNGFTYRFSVETTYHNWRNPSQGRKSEWRSEHFTIEEAVRRGFETDKQQCGFYEGNVDFG